MKLAGMLSGALPPDSVIDSSLNWCIDLVFACTNPTAKRFSEPGLPPELQPHRAAERFQLVAVMFNRS